MDVAIHTLPSPGCVILLVGRVDGSADPDRHETEQAMTTDPTSVPGADPATIDRISVLVTGILSRQPQGARSIGPADSLSDAGVSSLDMVNLMLALESTFDIFIPPEMIKPSSFRSIASIAAMIDTLRPAPVALAS